MDFIFHSHMNQQQVHEFGDKSMQKERNAEAYLQKHEELIAMEPQMSSIISAHVAETVKPIEKDMPQSDPNEKESKRRKRHRNQLLAQENPLLETRRLQAQIDPQRETYLRGQAELRRQAELREQAGQKNQQGKINRGKMDERSEQIFQEILKPEMFSPKYVLENFAQVREKLDTWKEHLRLYSEGGAGEHLMADDQKLRLEKMRTMYEDGERALATALMALGFRYEFKKDGRLNIAELKDPEAIQQALKDNMIAREKLRDQGDMDQQIADTLMENKMVETRRQAANLRASMQAEAKYSFIHSTNMSHEYHYDEVEKVKALIEKHPQEYRANKVAVDTLFEEFFKLMEVNGEYNIPSMAANELAWDKKQVESEKIRKFLNRKVDEQEAKMQLIRARAACIKSGIKNLLEGQELTYDESIIIREYLRPNDEREQRRGEAEKKARTYADIYHEKKETFNRIAVELYGEEAAKKIIAGDYGRYMMFMEKNDHEHNVSVLKFVLEKRTVEAVIANDSGEAVRIAKKDLGRAAKPLVIPYLQKIWDFDTRTLQGCTDEELLARADELQQIYISGMHIADAAKCMDPDDPEERSIKDAFVGERKEAFALKSSCIQEYAVRARLLTQSKAYAEGALTKECFTSEELRKIRGINGLDLDAEVGMNHMLRYVKDGFARAQARVDSHYNKFFHSDEAKALYAGYSEVTQKSSHPEYDAKLMSAVKDAGNNHTLSAEEAKQKYDILKVRVQELKNELQQEDDRGVRTQELQAEIDQLQENMQFLQIWSALTDKHYTLAGAREELIAEPIFRSYSSVDNYESFRNMGEERFTLMCKHLAAGTFETETATPEQIEAYRAENVQGLMIYKQHMREHYEMLEERFHHKVPSLEYIVQHRTELSQLFGNIQVDTNLVTYSKDMIDLRNEDDARLYHLVQTYNAMGGYIIGVGLMASHICPEYKEAVRESSKPMKEQEASFDYLDEEHVNMTQEQRDVAEKFRDIRQRSRSISNDRYSTSEKMQFLVDLQNFKAYIDEHENMDDVHIKMFKRWHEEILKNIDGFVSGIYHSVPGMKNDLSVLRDAERFKAALASGDMDAFMNAFIQYEKLYYVIQEDLPDEKLEEFRARKKWNNLRKISDEFITDQVNTEIDRDINNVLLPKGVTAGLSMENRHVLYEKIYEHYHELSARVEGEQQRLLPQVPAEIPETDRALYALQMVMYTALGKEYKAVTKMTYDMKTTNTNSWVIGQWMEKNMDKKTLIERVDAQVVDAQNKYGRAFKDMGIARKLGDIYANEFNGVVGF